MPTSWVLMDAAPLDMVRPTCGTNPSPRRGQGGTDEGLRDRAIQIEQVDQLARYSKPDAIGSGVANKNWFTRHRCDLDQLTSLNSVSSGRTITDAG